MGVSYIVLVTYHCEALVITGYRLLEGDDTNRMDAKGKGVDEGGESELGASSGDKIDTSRLLQGIARQSIFPPKFPVHCSFVFYSSRPSPTGVCATPLSIIPTVAPEIPNRRLRQPPVQAPPHATAARALATCSTARQPLLVQALPAIAACPSPTWNHCTSGVPVRRAD
ncbi:uncharacterized protein LOC131158928 [Malania oleifera]|uniref:uncharacterized protein LOC131158928 n=1 Tax=Malania oleifera TaxID=397392 RepID=UPI0025AE4862|nr:uncharacterized protein LOC131158928 [Malania oleifera]